jgi:hypothetical protein
VPAAAQHASRDQRLKSRIAKIGIDVCTPNADAIQLVNIACIERHAQRLAGVDRASQVGADGETISVIACQPAIDKYS